MVIEQFTPVRDILEKEFDKVHDIPSTNTFKQETLNSRPGKSSRSWAAEFTFNGLEIEISIKTLKFTA